MDKFQQFMTLFTAIAVPTAAFIIRMSQGDTKNEYEVVISRTIRSLWDRFMRRLDNKEFAK